MANFKYHDTLYGEICFDKVISDLVFTPAVQRLRHISMSNINSIDLPGISKITRFEHVLGVTAIASKLGLCKELDSIEKHTLQASALLHDWAIPPFGHLVEEAFQFLGKESDHELRPEQLAESQSELGGINPQILEGREAHISSWIARHFPASSRKSIQNAIIQHIQGKGSMGKIIADDFDIDNLDNVWRVAVHLGIEDDRLFPIEVAKNIISLDKETKKPIFSKSIKSEIERWSVARRNVYTHLMLSPIDFVGKIMLIYASIQFLTHENADYKWKDTDTEFICDIKNSQCEEAKKTLIRWIVGELWEASPLYWLHGARPNYASLNEFSNNLTKELGRHCFAYGIKDKRERPFTVLFNDRTTHEYGKESNQWLFGVASQVKNAFTRKDIEKIKNFVESYYKTNIINNVVQSSNKIQEGKQLSLF